MEPCGLVVRLLLGRRLYLHLYLYMYLSCSTQYKSCICKYADRVLYLA